ncbi:MAG: N-6 DNA methylase, partial [Mycobacterium sp.]
AASRHVVFHTRGYEQLYRAIADLHEPDLAGTGDFALQRVAGASPRSGGGAGAPNSVTAQILVSAARGASGMVYDPACGIAQALLTLAGSKSVSSAVGIEIDEAPHFIATVRGLLRDRDARLVRANTLTEDPDLGLLADTIILEPPFGIRMDESDPYDPRWQFGVPPKSSADLAWVQHAVFHLAPGGAAYVLTPVGALFRGGREAGIRKQLLRADVVQAVVELPPRLLTYTSIGLALWVLRPVRASNVRARVAVIDATEQSEIAERIGDWLDGAERGQIAGVPHAFVDVEDVSSDGAVLSAARWVERAGVDARVVFATREAAEADLAEAIASVASLRTQPQIELEGSQRTTTMKELRTYEFGTLRQGSHNSSGPKSKPIPGLVSPRDVRDGLPRLDPASVAAAASAGMPLTEPGDVLFTTMGTVRAVVDHEGGRIPAKGVWVLHLDTSRFDPAFVAASISAKWNGVHQRGNSITHAVVNDLEIPVLPLEQQRRVAAELTRLDQSARQARALADAAERAAAAVLDVVRFGGDAR